MKGKARETGEGVDTIVEAFRRYIKQHPEVAKLMGWTIESFDEAASSGASVASTLNILQLAMDTFSTRQIQIELEMLRLKYLELANAAGKAAVLQELTSGKQFGRIMSDLFGGVTWKDFVPDMFLTTRERVERGKLTPLTQTTWYDKAFTPAYDEVMKQYEKLLPDLTNTELRDLLDQIEKLGDEDEFTEPVGKQKKEKLPEEMWLHPLGGKGKTVEGGRWGADRDYCKHAGVDYAIATGTPIMAAASGFVSAAGSMGGRCLGVDVTHPGGKVSQYSHLSKINVAEGQMIRQGETLGLVGSTGKSSGPHLDFKLKSGGQYINPTNIWGTSAGFTSDTGFTATDIQEILAQLVMAAAQEEQAYTAAFRNLLDQQYQSKMLGMRDSAPLMQLREREDKLFQDYSRVRQEMPGLTGSEYINKKLELLKIDEDITQVERERTEALKELIEIEEQERKLNKQKAKEVRDSIQAQIDELNRLGPGEVLNLQAARRAEEMRVFGLKQKGYNPYSDKEAALFELSLLDTAKAQGQIIDNERYDYLKKQVGDQSMSNTMRGALVSAVATMQGPMAAGRPMEALNAAYGSLSGAWAARVGEGVQAGLTPADGVSGLGAILAGGGTTALLSLGLGMLGRALFKPKTHQNLADAVPVRVVNIGDFVKFFTLPISAYFSPQRQYSLLQTNNFNVSGGGTAIAARVKGVLTAPVLYDDLRRATA